MRPGTSEASSFIAAFGRRNAGLLQTGYQLEQKVELIVSRGRIVTQLSEKVEYDLDALVGGINAGNAHDEFSLESPLGDP